MGTGTFSLHFILLQKLNSVFPLKQFSTPNLNVIDSMAKLEKEHRLVVAFELKNGMEEMENWAKSSTSSNFKGLFLPF